MFEKWESRLKLVVGVALFLVYVGAVYGFYTSPFINTLFESMLMATIPFIVFGSFYLAMWWASKGDS